MSSTLPGDLEAALLATAGAQEGFQTVEEAEAPFRRANERERTLVNSLNSACRVARLHDLKNQVCQQALKEFSERLTTLPAQPRVRELMVVNAENRILVNGAVIKQRRQGRSWVNDWLELMHKLGVGALVLRGTWTRPNCTALLECFQAVKAGDPEVMRQKISDEAAKRIKAPAILGVMSLEEAAEYAEDSAGQDLPPTQQAIFYYARLLALVEGGLASVRVGRSPDFQVRHVRATLMRIIESLRAGLFEVRLLALTGLPHSSAEPEAAHLTNTAILAMAMGRLLGLRRGYLIDLGFAAAYHDLGRGLLGKQALFQHGGRELSESHAPTLWSVGCALRARGFGSGGLLRVAVAQEAERVLRAGADAAGMRAPHVFSKLVAIASTFDRLCNGTPWEPPLGPTRALAALADPRRAPQDLYKLLRDVLGPRPRGSVLVLPSGEVGVVVDGGARRNGTCVVRVLKLAGGVDATRLVLREVPAGIGRALEATEVQLDWARALLK